MADMTFGQMREHAEKHGGFTPIPIGTYNMVVSSTEVKPSKSGVPQIMGRMQILDGPLAGKNTLNRFAPYKNDGDPNGMFFAQLAALGLGSDHPIWAQVEALGFEGGVATLAGAMVGLQAIVEITHDTYGNQLRDNVKTMKPIGALITPGTPPAQIPVAQAAVVAQPVGAVPTAPQVVTAPAQVAPQPVGVPAVAPIPTAAPVQPVAPVPGQMVAAVAPEAVVAVQAVAIVPDAAPVAIAPPQMPVATSAPVMPVAAVEAPIEPAQEASQPPTSPEAVVASFPTPPDQPF